MQEEEGEARWGLRRGDVIASIGASKTIAPVARDHVAAANGMDLPKYLDAPRVGTMTEGSSAEVGKPLQRRERTRECRTRKAKIEAKLERSKAMSDKDLRQ
jgi:hypothetical protein